jgi:methionyl-tRNA formyltransferase
MSWRVVIVTMIPPVLIGFDAVLREAGHQPVALLTMRHFDSEATAKLIAAAPKDLEILMPARRKSLVPLLESVEPDLVVCMGFGWKIPGDALAVPKHGWLNGHPSLLPLHRGPTPVAWAIRAGDEEMGVSFHKMDAELDTGPILVQRSIPFGEQLEPPDDFFPKTGPIVAEALAEALAKLEAGEDGTVQAEGSGTYETFFGDEDVWLDLARPVAEVHRLAWAWRYGMRVDGGLKGAVLEVDGTPVRILATSLTEVDGATRVECGDGPLWILETEELSEAELSEGGATQSSAQAPSTH